MGAYVSYNVVKSEVYKRRDLFMALIYVYCLLVSSSGLRLATASTVDHYHQFGLTNGYFFSLSNNGRLNLVLAFLLDISFIMTVLSTVGLTTYAMIERIYLIYERKWHSGYLYFVIVAVMTVWCSMPPSGFEWLRGLVQFGAGVVRQNVQRARGIDRFWNWENY
ncbi:unnamed protein product [Bursaphelenchus okinawaensis]|uniref:Uncharacterized protein n=1 Tax=Bursaphelenchus okinawaensis TaxID=465554 RepID=A0A811LKH0_9BILA|nr:unnamed protein product [Bursaphelenchus okinawaensis]CAG9124170.1 unnamed protein product [Bursaphelenchus okinawaensis]